MNSQLKAKKNKSIYIDITESDCNALLQGEEFHWTFDWVDVHIFNPDA